MEIFCQVRRFTWVEVGVLAIDRMTSIGTLCVRSEFERRHRSESPYRP